MLGGNLASPMTRRLSSAFVAATTTAALLVAVPGGAQQRADVIDRFVDVVAPARVDEGTSFTATATYRGSGTVLGTLFTWENGVQQAVTAQKSGGVWVAEAGHAYRDDGTATMRVRFRSSNGNFYRGVARIEVTNAPPVIGDVDDRFAPLDEVFTLDIPFEDPGTADTHEAEIDWGDGTSSVVTAGAKSATATHTYHSLGTRRVTVVVTDDDGDSDLAAFDVEVTITCLGLPVTIDLQAGPANTARSASDVIRGTPGPDVIETGRGDDVVCGEGGHDTIKTGSGNDRVDGGRGRDVIVGGSGNDELFGGPGADTIRGNGGHDELDGGPHRDQLFGGGGSDVARGGSGPDRVAGNNGDDALSGGRGPDVLLGGGQDDVLWGGPDRDSLRGQTGIDIMFRSESPDLDQYLGGPGADIERVGKRGPYGATRRHLTEEEALAFQGFYELSEFTTYHDCCANRVVNIQTMANTVHGHVVMPGETWGVNNAVGRRTTAKGYLPAGAIIGGYVQCCDHPANIGGGTSQFGTTIYNAIFFSGATDVEHQPHTLDFSRYPDGREATMGFPHPDVVFTNPFDHPILITTHHSGYSGRSITVRFWGDNGGITVAARDSGRFNVYGTSKIVYEPDSSLSPGQSIVESAAINGYEINVYRDITWPSGATRTDTWFWRYSAGPEVRRVHPCNIPPGDPNYTGEACPGGGGGDDGGGPQPQ
jgi:Ca2+-binding RTX toxin-like protein